MSLEHSLIESAVQAWRRLRVVWPTHNSMVLRQQSGGGVARALDGAQKGFFMTVQRAALL